MQSCGIRLIIHSTACFPQTQRCCPVVLLSLFQWITSDDHHYLVTQFRSLQLAYVMLLSWSIPPWKKEKFSLRQIFPSSVIFWNWLLRGWFPDYFKSRIGRYLDSLSSYIFYYCSSQIAHLIHHHFFEYNSLSRVALGPCIGWNLKTDLKYKSGRKNLKTKSKCFI